MRRIITILGAAILVATCVSPSAAVNITINISNPSGYALVNVSVRLVFEVAPESRLNDWANNIDPDAPQPYKWEIVSRVFGQGDGDGNGDRRKKRRKKRKKKKKNGPKGAGGVSAAGERVVHPAVYGADIGLEGAINGLIHHYRTARLTREEKLPYAQAIRDLIRQRYLWGKSRAMLEELFIWNHAVKQKTSYNEARNFFEQLNKLPGGLSNENMERAVFPERRTPPTSTGKQAFKPKEEAKTKEGAVEYIAFVGYKIVEETKLDWETGGLDITVPVTSDVAPESEHPLDTLARLTTSASLWAEFRGIPFYEAFWEAADIMGTGRDGTWSFENLRRNLRSTDERSSYVGASSALGGGAWFRRLPAFGGDNYYDKTAWTYVRGGLSGDCLAARLGVESDEYPSRAAWRAGSGPTHVVYAYAVPGEAHEAEILAELGGASDCRESRAWTDTVWGADVTPNDPHFARKGSWGQDYADQWALQRIGFKALEDKASAWHVTTGTERPVVVAVIDTGIDLTHPDIHINNIWINEKEIPGNLRDDDGNGFIDDHIGWNFVNNSNNPYDLTGHGTHVAGLIAARWNNGRGIAGINRGARIMVLKVLNDLGKGWGSNVARAIVYAVDNGAQVINLSASHEGKTNFMKDALAYAQEKGVLVVVSAGNKGLDTQGVEAANQPGTLVVSSTLPDDKRAPFTNWGQEVDVAAPGVDVLSLRARNTDLNRFVAEDPEKVKPGEAVVGPDRAYYRAAGTSFSTPLVSGLASLIWAKYPKLTSVQVARMIRQSARDIEVPGWDQFTGYGLVDARAALTADPGWYIVAKIHSLKGVQEAGQPVVEVVGTVEGSNLAGYEIQLGKGKEPKEWRTVAKKPRRKVVHNVVARLKAADFGAPGAWTVRLVARDRKGQTRESRAVITLR